MKSNKKINILFISRTGAYEGGAQQSLVLLLEGLDDSDFYPIVVCPKEGTLTRELTSKNIDWEIATILPFATGKSTSVLDFIKMWGGYSLGIFRLLYLLKKYSIDLVHTNTVFPLAGAIAAKICNIPHVWHVREIISAPDYKFFIRKKLVKKTIIKLSNKIICISKSVEKGFKDSKNKYKPITIVVYNSVDLNYYKNIKNNIRGKVVIGTVGAIRELKELHKIPEIIASILSKPNVPKFEWHIYGKVAPGSEQYFENLIQKIKEYGLEEYCIVKGYYDKKEIFSKINILAHIAKNEAFGRVFIEAMISGIPVVAVDSGGVKEVVKDNKTGYLINKGDDENQVFSGLLFKLINNKALILDMGSNGKKDVINRFDTINHINEITSIYKSIL